MCTCACGGTRVVCEVLLSVRSYLVHRAQLSCHSVKFVVIKIFQTTHRATYVKVYYSNLSTFVRTRNKWFARREFPIVSKQFTVSSRTPTMNTQPTLSFEWVGLVERKQPVRFKKIKCGDGSVWEGYWFDMKEEQRMREIQTLQELLQTSLKRKKEFGGKKMDLV